MTTSALGVARAMSSMNAHALGVDAGARVARAQRVDVLLAGLMRDARPRRRRRATPAPPARARSAPPRRGCRRRTSTLERAAASGEALLGRRRPRRSRRAADCRPTRPSLRACRASRRGNPVRTRSAPYAQNAVGEPGMAFEVVDDQRDAASDRHQCARKRCKAAEAEHDVGRAPANHATRLHRSASRSANGPEQQALPALAAHAGEVECPRSRRRAPERGALPCLRACPARTRASRAPAGRAATARPGKMWPPVPPVVIMTVPVIR